MGEIGIERETGSNVNLVLRCIGLSLKNCGPRKQGAWVGGTEINW